jgi:hypothetical protein
MFALVGRVRIKPGHEEPTAAMARDYGPTLVASLSGTTAYWARTLDNGELIQHSFWLFDTETDARVAQTTFNSLRDMSDAPAEFISADVCEVISQTH